MIKTVQTCDKCKKDREIQPTISGAKELGGWRNFEGKDLCPDCVKAIVASI